MKKTAISILLIAILVINIIPIAQGTETYIDKFVVTADKFSNKTLLTGIKNKQLYLRTIKNNSQWTESVYNFDRPIMSYCVFEGKVYVLYPTKQRDLYKVGCVNDDTIKDVFMFYTKNTITINSGLFIDDSNTFYILNSSSKKAEIYNKNGDLLKITSEKINKILILNGICYGVTNDSLHRLSPSGVSKTYNYKGTNTMYKISENYLIDPQNNIWEISDNSLIKTITVKCNHSKAVCETNNFIVCAFNNQLIAYDKQSGDIKCTYEPNIECYIITSYKNSITIFDKNYNSETYSSKSIFADKTTNATESPTNKPALNLNDLDRGKIIFVKQGTTIAQFKKQDKYAKFNVSFKDKVSGNIGTGMTVTINNGVKKRNYTTIVKGDITGEGNINSRDISAMFDHLLDINKLKGACKIAGDIDDNNVINNRDLVLLSKLIK